MTLGANVLSMLKIAGMSDAAIGRHITLEIAPEIPQGTNPKGWVGVLSHMGNWEIVGRLTKLFPQFRFGAIYQQLANGHVNRHLTETRARMGVGGMLSPGAMGTLVMGSARGPARRETR